MVQPESNAKFGLRVIASALVCAAACLVSTVSTANATDVKAGGIVIVTPEYEGSDSYRVIGVPFAFPVFSGGSNKTIAFNGIDDIRWRALSHNSFEAGLLGGYKFGRDEDDGILLQGIGDVDGGVVVGGFVGYRVGTAFFDVSYHHVVSGDTGGFFRLGASNKYQVSPHFRLKARVGVTYANDEFVDNYFSISAAQSANSVAGLTAFNADAGFKDVHTVLSGVYDITNRWAVTGSVGYKRLIGDAADSPVVESEDQFSATFGATYRFSLD